MGAPTWPRREKPMGAPFSEVMVRASSSARSPMPAAMRPTASIRSATALVGHGESSKAVRAAATARSTSPGPATGTVPSTCSVWASTTSRVSPVDGTSHRPPTNRRST